MTEPAETVKEVKSYPLSNEDLQRLSKHSLTIIPYDKLRDVQHIDEVFDSQGRAIILYLTENQTTGHWVGLIKRGNQIEFFDSYGMAPDRQLTWAHANPKTPYLSRLLRESGYDVIWNKHRFQRMSAENNTCGRHVISRLLMKDLDLVDYFKRVTKYEKHGISPDAYVTILTNMLLGR